MSRIIEARKPAVYNKLKLKHVEKAIINHFEVKNKVLLEAGKKPRLGSQQVLIKEMILVVTEVIEGQLKSGFRLDLSDELVALKVGVSVRRAKQLRLELKAAGIIFFPEWSKPKKVGDYPLWLLNSDFIDFKSSEVKVKRAVKNRKYKPLYYKYYSQACGEAYRELEEYDLYVTVGCYMARVYQLLDEKLDRVGVTKEMLLACIN